MCEVRDLIIRPSLVGSPTARPIDQLVYHLYALTHERIKIVAEATAR